MSEEKMPDDLPPRIAAQWKDWSPERRRLYERRIVNNSVRYRILKRDGFRCQICGRTKDDLDDQGKPVRLHVDHKTSMANGGKSGEDNLWTLCFDCNRGKGTHDLDEELEDEPKEEKPVKQRAVRVEEIQMADGTTAYRYSDGSLRNERGHMLQPLPGTKPITHENAREFLRARWEMSRDAFATGVAEGMGKTAPVDAWQRIGEKAAELLNAAKSTRGFADLARFTGEAGGFVPMARGREEMQEQPQEQPTVFVMIAQFVSQLHEASGDVIEGQIKD